jgi:hypothetical protein
MRKELQTRVPRYPQTFESRNTIIKLCSFMLALFAAYKSWWCRSIVCTPLILCTVRIHARNWKSHWRSQNEQFADCLSKSQAFGLALCWISFQHQIGGLCWCAMENVTRSIHFSEVAITWPSPLTILFLCVEWVSNLNDRRYKFWWNPFSLGLITRLNSEVLWNLTYSSLAFLSVSCGSV